jgi:hypothetical protein
MLPTPGTNETIDAIRSAFTEGDPSKARVVPKSRVHEWMRCPDLEVRGALYSMICNSEHASYVTPALEFDDYYSFVLDYLEQCIEQNPDGEWADSRYIAGHQLVAWIVDFWSNKEVPRTKIAEIKRRLGDLYRRGDDDVRDGVLNGVLEHLFENRQLSNYFKDWEGDPDLRDAYNNALLWTKRKL